MRRLVTALLVLTALAPVAVADEAPLRVAAELRTGDDVCRSLCDRYGLRWARGAWVRIRIVTDGFGVFLKTTAPGGVMTSTVGRETAVEFTANPDEPYFLEVTAGDRDQQGRYWLEVTPAPTQYRMPNERPPVRPPTNEERDPDARVHDTLGRLMAGYRASTALMVGRLDQIPQLRFPAQRGRCYRAAIVLGHGARLAPDIVVRSTLRTRSSTRTGVQTARSTPRVLALDDERCASADGTLEIQFESASRGTAQPVAGDGSFTVQVFERAIADGELASREAALSRRICVPCAAERDRCALGGGSACATLFDRCVRAGGVDPRSCEGTGVP